MCVTQEHTKRMPRLLHYRGCLRAAPREYSSPPGKSPAQDTNQILKGAFGNPVNSTMISTSFWNFQGEGGPSDSGYA